MRSTPASSRSGRCRAISRSLIKSLTDKLDGTRLRAAAIQAAFEQIERRIMGLADKIEAADQRFGELGAIERGIQHLTHQVREAREEAVSTAERVARAVVADLPQAGGDISAFRRDLETLHAHQAESDQRTQETLEAVHETLERLVERLASVETGLHAQPPAAAPAARTQAARDAEAAARSARPQMRALRKRRAPQPPAVIPPQRNLRRRAKPAPFMHVQRTERPPIDPDLPADTPLEPGTANARGRTPAERIAASEAALGPALGTLKREGEVAGKANFIAAARRAAQAAANEGVAVEGPRAEEHKSEETPTSLIGRFLANRRRALMVGVSALLVLYGTMQIVGMMGGSNAPREAPRVPPSQTQAPEARKVAAAAPAAAARARRPPAAAPAARRSRAEPPVRGRAADCPDADRKPDRADAGQRAGGPARRRAAATSPARSSRR